MMMNQKGQRGLWAGLVAVLFLLTASPAFAEDKVRLTMTEVPGGGTDNVMEVLSEIDKLDLRSTKWFHEQVRGRAFQVDGITGRTSDIMWVMRGSNIDVVLEFTAEGDDEYRIRFITPAEGLSEHEFYADRGSEGPTRGTLSLIRTEVERFVGGQPPASAAPAVDPESRAVREAEAEDPEVVRQRAAAEREALAERLKRDWVWARLHFRMFKRDFTAAGVDSTGDGAVYNFNTALFPGFEVDVEAFPFVLSNPDMKEAGIYVTYNHGFDGLRIIDQSDPENHVETSLTVHNMSIEGGAIYRLDSPLEENIRQLRFKIGARYDAVSVSENPGLQSTSMISLVLGTRLVLPVPIVSDQFGVTASVDVVPYSSFQNGAEVYGAASYSYGFGSELGLIYEVVNKLYLSAGYAFRLTRSNFEGAGSSDFSDSQVFDLNQGLRAGVVYQY